LAGIRAALSHYNHETILLAQPAPADLAIWVSLMSTRRYVAALCASHFV
jgi:hypothetical protein